LKSRDIKTYREWISRSSAERNTRIVLALDLDGKHPIQVFESGRRLLKKTIDNLCAVKLGRQTILNMGTERARRLIEIVHDQGIPCLVDDKLNDIGETNRTIAESYFRLGIDGLTASPFVGWLEGLQPLFKVAHENGKGVIVLTYMSHPGASEGYGQSVIPKTGNKPIALYLFFAKRARQWGADGVVVGATRPETIRAVRHVVGGKVPIYSPGIGAQGGRMTTSTKAGTDYFIIGRSITRSPHPERMAASYARESREA
jgi:orotidine-5'-phosphate decarboxylase